MRIALAQMNPHLGDFPHNSQKILQAAHRAAEKHADLVVFSELSLYGYPPYDALEHRERVALQLKELKNLVPKLPRKMTVVFGAVLPSDDGEKPWINGAVVVSDRKIRGIAVKQLLPSYDVFDDTRYFDRGEKTLVLTLPQLGRVAVTVCEDMWIEKKRGPSLSQLPVYKSDPLSPKHMKKLDLVVNLSASPFSQTQWARRLQFAKRHARALNAPFMYVNQVGGQDELIFDGRSFVMSPTGKILAQGALCEEDVVLVDMKSKRSEHRPTETDAQELLRRVLVLGLRDFLAKQGIDHVHLGLSGGIDSALVAALAVDALGASRVTGLILPGPYNAESSRGDALELARRLQINTVEVGIHEQFEALKRITSSWESEKELSRVSLMQQNLQARLRGLLLMAYANARGSFLLATSNKSELAAGYSTLYGDLCGALAPIGDLTKTQVYALAHHYNEQREVIPNAILEKAPTAELAPNQKDQDDLPPYEKIDAAIEQLVVRGQPPRTAIERDLARRLYRSEFKRWQSPPILRVSDRAFGRGRRMPIVQKDLELG